MNSPEPTVSVVIPCFNGAEFLRQTLESALNQTHKPFEVIVVDDGSTDDSAVIAAAFAPAVRVIHQENQGESVARNRGIDEAKGEWVAFLDADDLWAPRKLELQMAAAKPGVTAIHSNVYLFGSKSGVVDATVVPAAQRYRVTNILRENRILVSSLVVRRTLPVRFPVWTRAMEDVIYCLELLEHGQFALVPEALAGYRLHERSQTASLATDIHRHHTVSQWLAQTSLRISAEDRQQIQLEWIERVLRTLELAKWRREWKAYWEIRGYLKSFDHLPVVAAAISERIYPAWLYTTKDQVDRLLRRV